MRVLRRDWHPGWTNTELAEEFGVHPAQICRWETHGIPADALLLALYLTGRWDQPLPRPPSTFFRRLMFPIVIRQFCCFFQQAGVIATSCPSCLQPWEMELFHQVLRHCVEWERAVSRAATEDNRVESLRPLAETTIASALSALVVDEHPDEDMNPLRALANSPPRAVRACLDCCYDRTTRIAYGWAVNALDDQMILPPE
jgi:hypothetical protein